MSLIRIVSLLTAVVITHLSMCTVEPTSVDGPNTVDEQYSFAAQRLEQYLIYQDRLPSDLYAFSCPESLYSSVRDSYTIYYNVENSRSFRKSQTTLSSGFGIRFNIDSTNRGFPIKNVYAGSPADIAEIEALDTLVAVNGIDVIGISYASLKVILDSINPGVPVVLKVKRASYVFQIPVRKGEYLAPTVFTDSLNPTTVCIVIQSFLASTNFNGGTAAEFSFAVNHVSWAQNIILDLRQNGGGLISQCIDVASYFIPNGDTLVNVTGRSFSQSLNAFVTVNSAYFANSIPELLNKKVYILCDTNTASASEIVIAGLKSSRPDIKLIGTVTYGKGIGQSILLGPDSVTAKVTSQTFVRRDGTSYHGKGITPDIETSPKDALNKALEIINGSSLAKKGSIPRYESPDELLAKPLNDLLIQETELR